MFDTTSQPNKRDSLQVTVMQCNWMIQRFRKSNEKQKLEEVEKKREMALDQAKAQKLQIDPELTFERAGQFLLESFEKQIADLRKEMEKLSPGSPQHGELSVQLRQIESQKNELQADLQLIHTS